MQSVLTGVNRAMTRALLVLIAAWPSAVHAQNQGFGEADKMTSLSVSGEVLIEVETFGVGGVVRPGALAGIRVGLTDSATRPRAVAVHISVDDADGDTVEYQRIVTLNPGREMGVWLYPRIPSLLRTGSILTVVVRATTEGTSGQIIAGRQIAAMRIRPQQVVNDTDDLIGVVGPGALMGLNQYELIASSKPTPPSLHELSWIVSGLTPGLLPDAWEGWDAFSAVVWAGDDPGALSANQAQALIEWVHRGGHLVVVLRAVGSQWLVPNPLAELLPRVDIERKTDVDLDRYRNLLSDDEALGSSSRLASGATIHTLTPVRDATTAEASCIISGVDGCVVARRLVGAGMVSVVGLDLRSSQLARIVQADRFWNRVLGRRGDVRPGGIRPTGGGSGSLMSIGAARWVDDNIAGEISEVRVASVGVLLGLVVFIVYFLLAGPVGFAILKNRGWHQHSWVFFVAMAGLFTAITWTSVTALRPRDEHLWHFTLLQHVYGQPVQRARVFGSVLLPEYGQQEVQVGEAGVDEAWRQNLTPWADPAAERSLPFPDARAYVANVRDATSLNVPARSTIKQFQIEWLGGPRWGMPVPPHPDRAPRLGSGVLVSGQLVHDLPVALENVRIIVIEGQTSERDELAPAPGKAVGRLRARGQALARTTPWEPGEVLDLGDLFSSTASEPIAKVLEKVVPKSQRFDQVTQPKIKDWERDLLISLFPVVEQPDYTTTRSNQTPLAALSRRLTHRFDLGVWFTQPCVIIIGTLRDAPCPVPVSVDGRRLDGAAGRSSGRVLLQWVYPLRSRSAHFTNPPKGKVTH